jgi:hypothetical protein
MIRRMFGYFSRTISSKAAPSISGILMSETITSNGDASSIVRAALPPGANAISQSRR